MAWDSDRWPHFTEDEMRCKCGCAKSLMTPEFMDALERLRELSGGLALPVNSAYRCPDHNAAVSATGRDGPHTTGRAVDLGVSGETALRVMAVAAVAGMTGIGVNQKGDWSSRFIHIDNLAGPNRPAVWSY